MHPNFYHWHARAELKPSPSDLEPRWNAAAKFSEKLSPEDVQSLIRMVLFSGADVEFGKGFAAALVKTEPTFPIEHNSELLRVMAAACIQHRLGKSSGTSDAFALGLRAAAFPEGRVEPVCNDIMVSAEKYLSEESEKMRPAIEANSEGKTRKQLDPLLGAMKQAVESNAAPEINKASEALMRGVVTAMKDSQDHYGQVLERLTEETQYLWWLIGGSSPALGVRRDRVSGKAYSLPAASEAADRVASLPPAESVESFLKEVLSQCGKREAGQSSLLDLILACEEGWVKSVKPPSMPADLAPISSLLAERSQGGKPDNESLKKLGIGKPVKVTPIEASRQYFRELMFMRAVEELN